MIGLDTTFLVHLEIREMSEHRRAHELLREKALDAGDNWRLLRKLLPNSSISLPTRGDCKTP